MATVTKERQTKQAAKAANTKSAKRPEPMTPPRDAMKRRVAINWLTNELNPRKQFEAGEIEALAATIRNHGLLQPLVVRQHPTKPGHYQVVAGGRRLRACAVAGLEMIPCEEHELTDAEALEIALVENLARKDLNAIEEAEAFAQATAPVAEGGLGLTQTALAARLGCTRGHIANRIRLLALPEKWRKRVISGEIAPSIARELVPFAAYPQVLDPLEKGREWEGLGAEELRDALFSVLHEVGHVVQERLYASKINRWIDAPKIEDPNLLQLVSFSDGRGGTTQFALNTAAYDKLRWAAIEKAEAKARKKQDREEEGGRKEKPAAKRSEAEAEAQFAKRLSAFRTDWQRHLVARRLAEPKPASSTRGEMLPTTLLLWLGGAREGYTELRERRWALEKAIHGQDSDDQSLWKDLARMAGDEIPAAARRCICNLFWDATAAGPSQALPDYVVAGAAEALQIDLAAAWRADKCGLLTEAYFALHTKEQLTALASELGVYLDPGKPKSTLVQILCGSSEAKTIPAELAGPPAKSKPKRRK